MSTLVCVPLFVEGVEAALAQAERAKDLGADLVEYRVDELFSGEQAEAEAIRRLVAASPLACIVTCRPTWEGGFYDGDEDARISLYEFLAAADVPPAYIDVELKAYEASENIRQKVHLACVHPTQRRDITTRLILSMHDFEGRPEDLTRRVARAFGYGAASVVKVAFRCRSLRDNLELFELLDGAPKPMIALGMGEFGLMSRVLAPKFGGFLTFASLTDESATAPGQPTVSDLLGMYRFRSIGKGTKVYGVIGWPVTQSMSPRVHNAGFEAVGWDGVYLPLPVVADTDDPDGSDASFKATVGSFLGTGWFCGASVTIPHKVRALAAGDVASDEALRVGAANTLVVGDRVEALNTDVAGIAGPLGSGRFGEGRFETVVVCGAGGAARAAVVALGERAGRVVVLSRRREQAEAVCDGVAHARAGLLGEDVGVPVDLVVNCTPVGMAGGPDPEGSAVDVDALFAAGRVSRETVFFDTVYNPIETPMLRAAKRHGCRTIDGVEMFVRQAAAQFELWTGRAAPVGLFDRAVREHLAGCGAEGGAGGGR